MAERLCAEGFAVLRFDFHGTGDSAGDERDPGRVEAWKRDIGAAIDEARARSGVADVSLVGLRLGATFAAEVASHRDDVASAVLWHPFLTGSAFVNETLKMHKMHRMLEPESFSGGPKEYAEGVEALGFFLTRETIADLGKIDLLALPHRPAPHVLVVDAANLPSDEPLIERLRTLEADASSRHMPGHKFLISIPHKSALPTPVIDSIIEWLTATHAEAKTATPRATFAADRMVVPHTPTGPARADVVEEPLVVDGNHRLFGILVRPQDRARSDLPTIVMTNAGTVHRIGPHRIYVSMARAWAAIGFDVLRLDLSGIGDSPVAAGSDENLCYPKTGVVDCQDAMTALEAKTGAKRFIVAGLCSGGDFAYQMGIKEPRVVGVVMMNPRTFGVNDLAVVDAYNGARYYQESFFKKDKWRKLLSGQVDVVRVAKMLAPKVKGVALRSVKRAFERVNVTKHEVDPTDVPGSLRRMAMRGVDTLLVTTINDPGVDFVDVHFGNAMKNLYDRSQVSA